MKPNRYALVAQALFNTFQEQKKCDPVTLTVAAIATTGIQIYTTNQAAKATFKAQNEQAKNALEEKQSAAEEELGQRLKEFRKTRARARVAGGESGAQGQSFAVGLNQTIQDQNADTGIINKNLVLSQRQTLNDLKTANSNVRTVSGLEAGLQIGTAALGKYSGAKAAQYSGDLASSTNRRLPVAVTALS